MTAPSTFEWKISTLNPRPDAYLRMCLSYSGSFMGPKTSICAFPRMFIPAPWMTRTFGMTGVSRMVDDPDTLLHL
ncbi:hypothetical protein D3C83_77040 [compost metagenome]